MKFLLISDIHGTNKSPVARKDNVFLTFLNKFEYVLKYAKQHNAYILQSGDFFHTPRNWYVLFQVMKLINKYKVHIYTVWGQHDMYLYSDVKTNPTNLGIAEFSGYIHLFPSALVTRPRDRYYYFDTNPSTAIYGSSWDEKIHKPGKSAVNILVIHAPIYKHSLFPKHDFTNIQYFVEKNPGWTYILIGDIHRSFFYEDKGTIAINTGPMMRLEGNLYNFRHHPHFYILDSVTGKTKRVGIPHKPAQEILTRTHIKSKVSTDLKFAAVVKKKTHNIKITKRVDRIARKRKANKRVKQILNTVISGDQL